jgi:predicted P-loop ATPase
MKDKKIWVNWKKVARKDNTFTKVPYQINGKPASSTDPETWSTYEEVNENVEKFSGIGIVLEPTLGKIVGIDFDHCLKDNKILVPEIEEFIKQSKTYCELSPSGEGLHVLLKVEDPLELERNKHHFNDDVAVEIYSNGRYFTFTENEFKGSEPLRSVSASEFENLIKILGYPWKKEEPESAQRVKPVEVDISLNDEELLQKMFVAKNGSAIKALYAGDASEFSNDLSSADFSLCCHLAFWTGKDKERMRSLWVNSPLGQRKKTQERKDYQDRTLDNAISSTTEIYSPTSEKIITTVKTPSGDEEELEFIMSAGKDPKPLVIFENICRLISTDPLIAPKFRLNDFSHMVETCWKDSEWYNLKESAVYDVWRYVSTKYLDFSKVSKQMLTDAIIAVAGENSVNPPKDYIMSIKWDGVPRLNSWLHHSYGVPDDALNQAIGSNWFKGMVKRIMKPGCIFDEVLALESGQGWRKSTSIRELGSPWHVETTHSTDDKDFYMILAQNIIVEFSEGDIFDRTSVKKLKAEITKTEDQFRPPYERGMLKFKRSCVFAVTTNKLELKDDTGNRRWLPVRLEKPADIDWIKANRDQLYAEAYHRVMVVGETTWEYPKQELQDLQDSRAEWGEDDEKVLLWYTDLSEEKREEEGISLTEAGIELYGPHKLKRNEELNIATILRRTLKLENKSKKVNGATLRRWFPTEATNNILKDINLEDPFKWDGVN